MENNYTKKLITFIAEVGTSTVVLNKMNKFGGWKYADITSMLEVINEVAKKNNCAVTQFIKTERKEYFGKQTNGEVSTERIDKIDTYNTLETVVVSDDGGFLSSGVVIMPKHYEEHPEFFKENEMLKKDLNQIFGATSTYFRKFQLQALLGLKTGDDPEAELGKDEKQSTPTAKPTVKKTTPTPKPTVKKTAPKTAALSDADVPPAMNNPFGS